MLAIILIIAMAVLGAAIVFAIRSRRVRADVPNAEEKVLSEARKIRDRLALMGPHDKNAAVYRYYKRLKIALAVYVRDYTGETLKDTIDEHTGAILSARVNAKTAKGLRRILARMKSARADGLSPALLAKICADCIELLTRVSHHQPTIKDGMNEKEQHAPERTSGTGEG